MGRLGYRKGLDGLRGLAIVLVLAAHFAGWSEGARGVDLFFVLSGFLITTLLLEERSTTGRISLRRFYARRARRLLPALATLLAFYAVVQIVRGADPLGPIAAFGLYVGNLYTAYTHGDGRGGLSHLWSLAEEEQFYAIWPVAMIFLLRGRRPALMLTGLAGAVIVYRAYTVEAGGSWWHVYYLPWMRADGLILGAAAAVAWKTRPIRVGPLVAAVAFCIGGFVLAAGFGTVRDFILVVPLFELVSVVVVLAAISGGITERLLSVRPLVELGRISYSVYLWHVTLLWLLVGERRIVVLALSLAAAWASYRWIEQPVRRKHRNDHRTATARPVRLLGLLELGGS